MSVRPEEVPTSNLYYASLEKGVRRIFPLPQRLIMPAGNKGVEEFMKNVDVCAISRIGLGIHRYDIIIKNKALGFGNFEIEDPDPSTAAAAQGNERLMRKLEEKLGQTGLTIIVS